MAVVGITGNIASGKSTFRDTLAGLTGARVFDADSAAKDLLARDPDIRSRVVAELGPSAYTADGTPDRDWLRRRIFDDAEARRRLEAILHPAVRRAWSIPAKDPVFQTSHFLVDIPLLFETGADSELPYVVVVACSPAVQECRLAARGLDAVTAHRIIDSQMPQDEKIARASVVVWNDGSLEVLEAQARVIASRWVQPPAGDLSRPARAA